MNRKFRRVSQANRDGNNDDVSRKYYCKIYLHIIVSGQRVGDVWNKDVLQRGRVLLFNNNKENIFCFWILHKFIIIIIIINIEGKTEMNYDKRFVFIIPELGASALNEEDLFFPTSADLSLHTPFLFNGFITISWSYLMVYTL